MRTVTTSAAQLAVTEAREREERAAAKDRVVSRVSTSVQV